MGATLGGLSLRGLDWRIGIWKIISVAALKPRMRPELLAIFGSSLSGFIGRRVRVYTVSGEIHIGRLERAPEPFYGVDSMGLMERRGTYILATSESGECYIGDLSQLRTFDVLSG